jgi:para-aminobenzoate synthetase component 1
MTVSSLGLNKLEVTTEDWCWRSLPLNGRSAAEIFTALFNQEVIATLLESPHQSPSNLARYSICAGGVRCRKGISQQWTPDVGEILSMLRSRIRSANPASNAPFHLPFIGGWLGWLGYDLAWEIERLPQQNTDPLPFPVAFWYEPEAFAVLDHRQQELWLAAPDEISLAKLEQQLYESTIAISNCPLAHTTCFKSGNPPTAVAPNNRGTGLESINEIIFHTSQTDYEAAILKAKAYIEAGDIFQTNLSLRFSTTTTASSWDIYQALQQINPSPFASYWKTPWGDVISCSPERLVEGHWDNDRFLVSTRPIAGTRKRGQTPEQDQQLAAELLSNTKEQAEHIMLVDLERNDLGRVCQWGTVQVNELLAIEHYSHVMHLVSNIIGELNPTYDSVDLIRALFPGGTITGCPKVRCMEIIEELEPARRSLFYGSCGYLDVRGQLDLNILIRTLLYARATNDPQAQVWGQVGAGIVADSDPTKEWYESLQKAQAQLRALQMAPQ